MRQFLAGRGGVGALGCNIIDLKYLPVLLALLFVCQGYCATYFVSPLGNDTTGNGTIGSPYLTIGKAVGVATAGDTIYLRGGTYSLSTTITISKSGTSGSMFNLRAYPGDTARPLLDFSAMAEDGSNRGIRLSASYWIIYGIDIYGAGDNGMNISGSYNIIEFCSFYENHDTGLQLGGGAAYNQIINCDSYYNADSSLENADGFAPKLDVGTGNYFYGCRAWQNLDDGYDGYLRPADGILTTYENCWAFKNGYLKSGAPSGGDGNGFKMGGSDDKTLRHNVILNRCLSFQNAVKGFDQNNNKGSMTLYNCTAFNNGTYNFSIPAAPTSGQTATIINGVSFGSSGVSLNASVVQTTDSWLSPFVVTAADFVSIDPAAAYGPRNADGSLPDISFMHLAVGSDLIDGGTNIGLPFEGTAPDLGAYEYSDGGDYAPAAPTGFAATAGYETISLDWNDNSESDLNGYNIYRSTSPGGPYITPLNGTLLNSSDYGDMDVIPNTTYYYVVTAVDVGGSESTYSSEDWAAPILYGDFVVNGIVETDDLDYLSVLWLQDDCQLTDEIDLGGDCIVNYCEFWAFARNWNIPDAAPPAAPTGLSATAGNGTVLLDWNDNNEIDLIGYNIYRSTDSGSGFVRLNGTLLAASAYTDNTVSNGTTYYYVVTAVDASVNESGHSNEVWATPDLPVTSITIQENETGFCGFDGTIDSNNTGFTGDGFVNTPNEVGYGIDYRITILTAGTYTFAWRYANGSSNRPGNLIINGTTAVSGISFAATGGWTTWITTAAVEVTLTAGVKEIRLEATSSGGLANIDYMQITGPNLQAASCP